MNLKTTDSTDFSDSSPTDNQQLRKSVISVKSVVANYAAPSKSWCNNGTLIS